MSTLKKISGGVVIAAIQNVDRIADAGRSYRNILVFVCAVTSGVAVVVVAAHYWWERQRGGGRGGGGKLAPEASLTGNSVHPSDQRF